MNRTLRTRPESRARGVCSCPLFCLFRPKGQSVLIAWPIAPGIRPNALQRPKRADPSLSRTLIRNRTDGPLGRKTATPHLARMHSFYVTAFIFCDRAPRLRFDWVGGEARAGFLVAIRPSHNRQIPNNSRNCRTEIFAARQEFNCQSYGNSIVDCAEKFAEL